MKVIKAIGMFFYDFIIGDDWKIAASVAVVLTIGGFLAVAGANPLILTPLLAVAVAAAFVIVLFIDTKTHPEG
ncbi:MAG: hypothetical protein ABI130_05760 [Leifsonia sp.]